MKAVVVRVAAKPEIVELSDNENTAFEEVRKLVDGFVTRVRMGKFDLYCDEDGLPRQLPPNRVVAGEPIVGTFVVLKHSATSLAGITDNEASWLVKDLDTGGCLLKPLAKTRPGVRD